MSSRDASKDTTNSRKGTQLTNEECVNIKGYKELDYSNLKIARILNRAPQTINSPIYRGNVCVIKQQRI